MRKSENNLVIVNKTKGKLQRLPFWILKNTVLGKKYALDLIFVTPRESRNLNQTYRKKNKPTNVLSFPLSKNSGQIVLCPHTANQEAKLFDKSRENFIGYLFIHGLLHLKGYQHGSTMEYEETRLSKKFLLF